MFKQVFISHAKEDYVVAEELYDYLHQNNYSPWLDKKKIKVGENWDFEINNALKNSTFVILLLSSISINKRGYVQKEFNKALRYAEEKLIDDIYIIPILLDKCEVPKHLGKYQWIEIDENNAMEEILFSLNKQREKYFSSLPKEERDINNYTTISIEHGLKLPHEFDYTCELPLFYENKYFDATFINTFIQQKVLEKISDIRSWMIEIDDEFVNENCENFYLNIWFNIDQLNEKFMSLSIIYDSYLGGAHPNTSISTLNFTFSPDRILQLDDLVQYNELHEFIYEQLIIHGDEEQKDALQDYIEDLMYDNIDFTFNNEILEIYFTNYVPRVIMALATLEIPLKDLELRMSLFDT